MIMETQEELPLGAKETVPTGFDGETFDKKKDGLRLGRQLLAVRDYMTGRGWVTISEVAAAVSGSQTGVAAAMRSLRKEKFGGHLVESRRRKETGLWEYQLDRSE